MNNPTDNKKPLTTADSLFNLGQASHKFGAILPVLQFQQNLVATAVTTAEATTQDQVSHQQSQSEAANAQSQFQSGIRNQAAGTPPSNSGSQHSGTKTPVSRVRTKDEDETMENDDNVQHNLLPAPSLAARLEESKSLVLES